MIHTHVVSQVQLVRLDWSLVGTELYVSEWFCAIAQDE